VKINNVSNREIVIALNSVVLESHPPEKNVVRGDSPLSGFILKQISENHAKVSFIGELDYKLSLFIAK
jgi:hypothetical protein